MDKNKKITLSNYLLEDISVAMQSNDSYEIFWYLDVEEEKVIIASSEVMEYDEIEEIENNLDRYIPIPETYSSEAWEEMRDFILDLEVDDTIRGLLLNSIEGPGAFRRFKDAIDQVGKLDDWYEYSNRLDYKRALDWLVDEGLIDEEYIEEGLRLHDEAEEKRKQIKDNLQYMNKGVMVECTYDTGHAGRISPGTRYNIIDEKPQHLMIRIRDDENKVRWYPKAHFKLVRNA